MNRDQLKQYLYSAGTSNIYIDSQLEVLDRLESLTQKATSNQSNGMPRSQNGKSKEDIYAEYIDLKSEINNIISREISKQKDITIKIDNLIDNNHRIILTMYYINGKDISKIAKKLNKSESWCEDEKRKALDSYINNNCK